MIWTYQDSLDSLIDFLGGGPSDQVVRSCRQAILDAYREFVNAFKWPYLYHHGRIITTVPFNTGTMAYDHTGGTYERQVTLTGGVWPSYAAACYLRIADVTGVSTNFVAYRVAQRISDTVLTLDPLINPGGDIPALTGFTLYQDTYLLPEDYVSQDEALYELNFGGMQYTHPREWLYENRYVLAQGTPQYFTISGDPQYPGRLVMRVFPWPSDRRSIDFIYFRRPRPLLIQQATGGTLSLSSGSNAILGTGTTFTPGMVGSVLRVSGSAKPPSNAIGSVAGFNPPVLESLITAWISPTAITVDTPSPATYAAVNYYVSDPIDFEQGAMLNGYMRCTEKCLAVSRTLKNMANAQQSYRVALDEARAASSPSFAGRHAGPRSQYQPRLRDYPQGADQP